MRHVILTISLLCLILAPAAARAQQAALSASTHTPEAGQPFTLSVRAEGQRTGSLGVLDIPGLSVLSQSRSTNISMSNGRMSASTTFNYQIVAEKEGPLTIEGIELEIDGRKVKTNSLQMTVRKSSGQGRSPQLTPRLSPGVPSPPGFPPPAQDPDTPAYPSRIDDETAFLKVIPPREEIYAGETVELEIKAYLDAGIPILNFARELNLESEDFIFQPTVGPDVQMRQRGGRRYYHFEQERIGARVYNVLTYKTTATAVKPGSFELPSLDFTALIQAPRENRPQRRPRNSLDALLGDPFDDPFFDSILNNRKRELRLQSDPVKLKVLPLPTEGRPESFGGAIGRFSLDVKADKDELKTGEALKMTATVTGHGNFERIGSLESETGAQWKAYPPEIEFQSADHLKLSGEKAFGYTYIATGPTSKTPAIQFAYFDPEAKKYVTLSGGPLPVTVTGGAAPALSNQDLAALADQAAEIGPRALAVLASAPGIRFFREEPYPLLGTGSLLALNGTAAAVALGLLAWRWRSRPRTLSPARQRRRLRSEYEELRRTVGAATDPQDFSSRFFQVLVLHSVLNRDETPAEWDDWDEARRTVTRCPSGSPERRNLEGYLNWVNTRRWSGKTEQGQEVYEKHRQDWLDALESLRQGQEG